MTLNDNVNKMYIIEKSFNYLSHLNIYDKNLIFVQIIFC